MAEQKQGALRSLPKNIRQIGTSTGITRVYLEDYVYTCLHMQDDREEWLHRGFVLLGRIDGNREHVRYFVSGMIRLKDSFFKNDIMEFADEAWAYIFQEMKKYYEDLEIVGWGQDVSSAPAGLTAEIERVHKQNFNIQKNVLFLLDRVENEEAFYIFEKNMLQRREGYYVYYEKNPQMQEYMIQTREKQELNISPEDIKEPLVHSYREILLDRKAQLADRKWNGVLYATSMILVLSVCVLGVSTVNNVEKMQNLETAVSRISGGNGQAGMPMADTGAYPAMSQNIQKDQPDGTGSENGDTAADDEQDAGRENSSSKKDQPEDENISSENKEDSSVDPQEKNGDDLDKNQTPKASDKAEKEKNSQETSTLTDAQTYLLQGYYIVKKGDSLVSISKKIYGTPKKAEKIRDLNGIENMDKIYAGQKLELP